MYEWIGKRVEVLFRTDAPKLEGSLRYVSDAGVTIDTGDDGTALAFRVVATFVPFATIRHINLLEARTPDEQERKRHELEERFRRLTLEQSVAPTARQIELLEREDI